MQDISFFKDIADNPEAYARKWKDETRGRIIGHFCSYTPIEIVIAAGALPFRVLSLRADSSRADAHLQSYCCNVVRSALHDALSGRLDFLDGAVFPHTCDSIQRLSDIWRINNLQRFHADVILPVKLNSDSAREYLVEVLARFRNDLERGLGVEITADKLREAIDICNRNRKSLGKLYRTMQNHPKRLRASELYQINRAAMVMDGRRLADKLDELVSRLESVDDDDDFSGKRIILSGGVCHVPDISRIIEKLGAAVVWDDFCTGARYFQGFIDEKAEPIEAIARRYFDRIVCPAKHASLSSRGDYLVEAVKYTRAHGIVFVLQKFCDPHAFDYPYLRERLVEIGIPSILIEIESQQAGSGQLETRIEAFLEIL